MIPSIILTSSSESTTGPQRDTIINDVTSSSSHSNDEDFLDNTEMIIKREQKTHLNKMQPSNTSGILLCLALVAASLESCLNLGSAANFTIIGASSVINADLTVINGNVAISPGITLTGFNPFGVINDVTTLGTSVAGQAQNDGC
ncbi:unnamed protein product [Rotaria socialis]|uniref:Uncharacterized protein n=2 Tax=Rotaria socialis TaxID=392032 RepID=A0A817Z681_9BILA|nr:unnamed protein product [Rotaria socialis]CAF3456973.1 unnamed protein product [Rotaria socialis]CAF4209325.1 unnamed protein product [Rotaria socialis]CAF4543253.1 unnamed protein product [Rotaria socialis]